MYLPIFCHSDVCGNGQKKTIFLIDIISRTSRYRCDILVKGGMCNFQCTKILGTGTENYCHLSVLSVVNVRRFIFIDELTLILGVSALCVWWFVKVLSSGRVRTDKVGFRSSKGMVKSVGLEVGGVTVRLVCVDFTSQNINSHLCQNGNMLKRVFFSFFFLKLPLYITRKLQLGTFVF